MGDKNNLGIFVPKLLIIISNNEFWVLDTNFSYSSPKQAKKTHFWIQIFVLPMTKML